MEETVGRCQATDADIQAVSFTVRWGAYDPEMILSTPSVSAAASPPWALVAHLYTSHRGFAPRRRHCESARSRSGGFPTRRGLNVQHAAEAIPRVLSCS